ncbi:Uncharacterized protein FWK35_00034295, partial [Aphis craccivora]
MKTEQSADKISKRRSEEKFDMKKLVYMDENSVKDLKWRYPLLTIQQCEQIINNCLIKKYSS